MQPESLSHLPKHYSELIRDIFYKRSVRNENYSLRAFARDLKLSPSYLSEILSQKAILSVTRAHDILENLNLEPEDQKLFLKLVEISNASDDQKKILQNQLYNFNSSNIVISGALYSSIAKWHYLALLELISVKDFENSLPWIAGRLSITQEEAAQALESLFESKLIVLEGDKIVKTYDYFVLPDKNQQQSAIDFHNTILKRASTALDTQKSEERNFAASFLHIKKADLPIITEKIKNLRRELAKEFESDTDADSVYMFSSQFFRADSEL